MIVLRDVAKTYVAGRREVMALKGINLQIQDGEFAVIRGPSGSGKTTLLMLISAMLQPTQGSVEVDGRDLQAMSAREKTDFRARTVGIIFQMFHLIPYLNVAENVMLASGAALQGHALARANELLLQLGLSEKALQRPSELSTGQCQRTAIARALLNRPKILLADEPTGNLDPENATTVFRHLADFQRQGGTVIVATHAHEAGALATRVLSLLNGEAV